MLQVAQPHQSIIIHDNERNIFDEQWLLFFNPQAAVESVINHVETLPGSRNERHTMRAYLASLADYCEYLGAVIYRTGAEDYDFHFNTMRMPTKDGTAQYIAACKRRGLTSKTVMRYMASVRHFIRALEEQAVTPRDGNDFMLIMECQRQFRLCIGVKNPAADTTSNRPALEQHGTRLTLQQVNQLFESLTDDITTTTGKRDLALLYLGITSGLRASELARITLNSITPGNDCYEVRVRGKRANIDPAGIDSTAYDLIVDYVYSWNNRLVEDVADDFRRITGDTPVFQPLLRGDNLPTVGLRGYDVDKGITARSILQIVERRSRNALGTAITAHDMRRTCAYLMRSNGFEWDNIRGQLRHKSIGTTEKYVGQEQDLSKALLSKRVTFLVPTDNRQPLPLESAAD